MDLLENVATELGFQFHLYLVRDEKYGAKYTAMSDAQLHNSQSSGGGGDDDDLAAPSINGEDDSTVGAAARRGEFGPLVGEMVDIDPDWDQSNGIDFNLKSAVGFW